jgi:hypothetical protein
MTFLSRRDIDILVYGGSAGSGKTWALLLDVVRDIDSPNFTGTLFRRQSVQITNEGGLWDESQKLYRHVGGKSKTSPAHSWEWPSGASLTMTHLNNEDDIYGHQGAQNAWIGYDELTQFTEKQFWYLQSRARSAAGLAPRTRATLNPDAGSWVKRFLAPWVDDAYPQVARRDGEVRWLVRLDPSEDKPAEYNYFRTKAEAVSFASAVHELPLEQAEYAVKSVAFIEASLADNKILMRENPQYLANLLSLPEVEKQRLLYKNWNILTDTFFKDWQPVTPEGKPWHVIPTGPVPKGCKYYLGTDWGYSSPCAHYLMAISHDGRVTVCREVYATQMKTSEQGAAMVGLIEKNGLTVGDVLVYAGHDVFNGRLNSKGELDEPIVRTWQLPPFNLRCVSSGRDPVNRASKMREYLANWGSDEGWPDGRPGIQVMDCCTNLIRTLPLLKSDEHNPEMVDTELEDHCLIADTRIDTDKGQVRIADLAGVEGQVFSYDGGLHRFHSVKCTQTNVNVYRVRFVDGREVTATANHPFLTTEGWIRVDALESGTRVVDIGGGLDGNGSESNGSGVSGRAVLSLRQLLPEEGQEIASRDMAESARPDTRRVSCASCGWQQGEQQSRQPALDGGGRASERPLQRPRAATATETTHVGQRDAESGGVASFGGGQGVAQGTRQAVMDRTAACARGLCSVWTDISIIPANDNEILLSHLQGTGQTAEIDSITPAGTADVYNMHVDDVESFSVEGGLIVHNSYDAAGHVLSGMPGKPKKPVKEEPAPPRSRAAIRERYGDNAERETEEYL